MGHKRLRFISLLTGFCAACAVLGAGLPARSAPDAVERSGHPPAPDWWKKTRALYCPYDSSGAGSGLMYVPSDGSPKIESFEDLPVLLEEARRLGSDVVYYVPWYEDNYVMKGDYRPSPKLGGAEAFRKGIRALHAKGGRILLYLEAFIIHRDSELGRGEGQKWAMRDGGGNPMGYYGRNEYYLMYPGEGSGWADYLAGVCERLAREFEIDGVHLDSYGIQWGLQDHTPGRPNGTNPDKGFNPGAVRLVREVRARMRQHRPESVVIMEGSEHEALLREADGAQIESPEILFRKPWAGEKKYRIFTVDHTLPECKRALDAGYGLMLTSWFGRAKPPRDKEHKILEGAVCNRNDREVSRALGAMENLAAANGLPKAPGPDAVELRRNFLKEFAAVGRDKARVSEPLAAFSKHYKELFAREDKAGRAWKSAAEVLKRWMTP
jgi:hypothetical protein